ncbi:hypothetical protein CAC42_587 [Sphaceloma murrayae]|uniref:PPM-type phosphatase domain-containing protein n=1 Tax=Sphaceloma murrayae TaxID=2082308 RepID=A0A2K1R3Y3_9PEZI|nr:hypothetical protein CAC42_587 [Sphaceloma murrayae]
MGSLAALLACTFTVAGTVLSKSQAPGDAPVLEETLTGQVNVEQVLSRDDVTRMLEHESYSHISHVDSSALRYDGTRLSSNNLCEDRFTHGSFPCPWDHSKRWLAWGIFDSHSGWQTAGLLQRQLLSSVRRSLESEVVDANTQQPSSAEGIRTAIMTGFVGLDKLIMDTAIDAGQSSGMLQEKVGVLSPAFADSCALLSLYDPSARKLYVACTGDSRAVLGTRSADGRWQASPLSVDQNGRNADEIARISSEHPGETGIGRNGRMLGLAVTRAFGDSRWKLPLHLQREYERRFYGPVPLTPRYGVISLPYLTAEPVVTSVEIDKNQPSFLIMASDGMWDSLLGEQAVELVRKWLDKH